MDKQLSEMSVIELKAVAYDLIANLEMIRNNLNAINQELFKRQQQEAQPIPPPTTIPRVGGIQPV
jgi:hypothetical protein